MNMKKRQDFSSYDYKEIFVDKALISKYLDGYKNFGWNIDENSPPNVSGMHGKTIIKLKRDRKIINKTELTRLERNFEACMKEIDMLEISKTNKATSLSLAVGVIGTAFMAGSVFAITAENPIIWLSVILAVPAFIGWGFAYPIYKKILKKNSYENDLLIDKKYDEIDEICEKGHSLLM